MSEEREALEAVLREAGSAAWPVLHSDLEHALARLVLAARGERDEALAAMPAEHADLVLRAAISENLNDTLTAQAHALAEALRSQQERWDAVRNVRHLLPLEIRDEAYFAIKSIEKALAAYTAAQGRPPGEEKS